MRMRAFHTESQLSQLSRSEGSPCVAVVVRERKATARTQGAILSKVTLAHLLSEQVGKFYLPGTVVLAASVAIVDITVPML
jgi:hypothetical protein